MARYIGMALSVLMLAGIPMTAPAVAQRNGDTISAANIDAPIVSFDLSEMVTAQADIARFTVSVSSRGDSAEEAMRTNVGATAAIIVALRAQGVSDADFAQSSTTLIQQRNRRTDNIRGYAANSTIAVETHDVGRVSLMIAAAIAAGATQSIGPYYDIENMAEMLSPARERLYRQGLAQANDYARVADYVRVVLVAIEERTVSSDYNDGISSYLVADMAPAEEALEGMAPPAPSTEVKREIKLSFIYRLHH